MSKKIIFEIPVWKINLSNILDLKKIENVCLNIQSENENRIISNIGGFQSQPLLLKKYPDFFKLYDIIMKESNKFCEQLKINYINSIESLWVNINKYQHYNKEHHHSNSILSGVFYAHSVSNINAGSIVFLHPQSDMMSYDWVNIQKDFIPVNSSFWKFSCEPGELIIFPSWLKHSVEPNLVKDYNRISISFNLK